MVEKKTFKDYTDEELIFNLGLYKEIEIDYANLILEEETKQTEYEFNINYIIKYSNDYRRFTEFFRENNRLTYYCPRCKKNTTLDIKQGEITLCVENLCDYLTRTSEIDMYVDANINKLIVEISNTIQETGGYLVKEAVCFQDESHKYRFIYRIEMKEDNTLFIQKVGQFPSFCTGILNL